MKYTNIATTVISVDINNNFIIYAFAKYNPSKSCHMLTLYLKNKNIDLLRIIEGQENISFKCTHMNKLKSEIATYIEKLNDNNYFESYISDLNYEQECFEIGNDKFEKERLGIK